MATLIKKIISTVKAPKPLAAYNQAVVVDRTVYCSGSIGLEKETGKLVPGGASAETKAALTHLKNVLEAADSSLEKVVKCTVLLADMKDYTAVNEEYSKFFVSGFPARTCYQVGKLPLGAAVEIEAIAVTGDVKIVE